MMKKRVISLVIVFTLLLSIFNIAVADSGTVYAWDDGSWKNSANDSWDEGDWIPIKLVPDVPDTTTTPEAITLTVGMEYTKDGSEPIGFDKGKGWTIGTDSATQTYTDLDVDFDVVGPSKFVATNGSEVLHYAITVSGETLMELADVNWSLYGKVHAAEAGSENLYAGGTIGQGASSWNGKNLQVEYVEANQTVSFGINPAPAVYSMVIEKTVDSESVYVGEDVTYTVMMENTGNQDLYVDFTDVDGNLLDEQEYIDLAVGATAKRTFTTAYDSVGLKTNTATAEYYASSSAQESEGTVTDIADVDVNILPVYLMTIDKTVDKGSVIIGEDVTYTVTMTNTGNQALYVDFADADGNLLDEQEYIDLAVGATVTRTFTTAYDSVGSKTNTATAEYYASSGAQEPEGTVTDSVDVDVNEVPVDPVYSMTIEKTVDSGSVYVGQDVTYTVTMVNTGNQSLWVDFTDADGNLLDEQEYIDLAVGATATRTFTTAYNAAGLKTNTATADYYADSSAQEAEGTVTDVAEVDVSIVPVYSMTIEKTVDSGSVYVGQDVTYTVTMVNTGNQSLWVDFTDVDGNLLDEQEYIDLAVGATATRTFTTAYDAAGLKTNTATADYYAGISSQESEGTVSDSADVDVNILPVYSMTIDKSVDKGSVIIGEDVTYTVTMTNTGNKALYVDFTDADGNLLDEQEYIDLAVGATATRTFTTAYDSVGSKTNTATAEYYASSGAQESEGTVTDSVDVDVNEVPVDPVYSMTIEKTVDSGSVYVGDDVTYTVTMVNTGNQSLWVDFTDADGNLLDEQEYIDLAVGATATRTFTTAYDAAGLKTNTATANYYAGSSAQEAEGTVTDAAEVDVSIVPVYSITINKTVDDSSVYTNEEVTYTVVVENTGNQGRWIDFHDHDDYGIDEYDEFYLDAGATTTMAFTTSYSSTGEYTNLAEATYYDGQETPVTVSDTAIVDVNRRPSTSSTDYGMTITKTADADEVEVGETITYTITVKNVEDGTLTNVEVKDDMVGLDETIISLGENLSKTFTVTYEAQEAGILENTATATDDRAGTETATATVIVNDKPAQGLPGLAITKTVVGDQVVYYPDDMVEFNIVVTNTGNTVLKGITVEDPMAGLYGYEVDELGIGESSDPIPVSMKIFDNTASFTNTATASVDGMSATDDAYVEVGEKTEEYVEIPEEETVPLDVPDTGAIPMMLIYGLGALGVGTGWSIIDRKKR